MVAIQEAPIQAKRVSRLLTASHDEPAPRFAPIAAASPTGSANISFVLFRLHRLRQRPRRRRPRPRERLPPRLRPRDQRRAYRLLGQPWRVLGTPRHATYSK
jgi:hypothetical protein